jgi:hypothetical protein
MIGTNKTRVIVSPRDIDFLEQLAETKILDREQFQVVAGISRINRANHRLLQLHSAHLIRRHFVGTVAGGRKAIYSLSTRGAHLIGRNKFWRLYRAEDELLIGDSFTAHQTAVNWVWISAKYRCPAGVEFLRWLNFREPLTASLGIIPDGYFEFRASGEDRAQFIEADLGTEGLKAWEQKTREYLKLATSGEFNRLFHQNRFRVLVTAPDERRLNSIRGIVRKHTNKLFFFIEQKTIHRDGLFTSSWLRPEGGERCSLI